MIFIKFTVGLFVALISLNSTAHAISFDEARHLLARTGFGVADPARIRALQPLSFEAAVDQLLGQVRTATDDTTVIGHSFIAPARQASTSQVAAGREEGVKKTP
jgi:hypothetical protein